MNGEMNNEFINREGRGQFRRTMNGEMNNESDAWRVTSQSNGIVQHFPNLRQNDTAV